MRELTIEPDYQEGVYLADQKIRLDALSRCVRDYMSLNPETLTAQSSLLDAALLLRRISLRHIPVLENDSLVGIITDRDVARCAPSMLIPVSQEEYNKVFEDTPLSRIMTKNPIATTPDTPLTDAVVLFHENRIGCLPVVENGQLVGIITTTDLIRILYDLIVNPNNEQS